MTMHDKQGKKMQPVQVVVGEAVITWPGAGHCCRTIADVDEPPTKPQLFIFGVVCLFVCFTMETLQAEASLQGIQVNHKLLPK